MPRRKQAPETTFGLEEVHQVVLEVVRDPATFDLAVECAHVHNVVADQEIGARAGAARTDAVCGNGRPDDVGRPLEREAVRGPRRSVLRFGNTLLHPQVAAIASRMNRARSVAIASVAQTIFTRRPGLWPSSQMMRQHTWKLLPWSRGSSMSARGWRSGTPGVRGAPRPGRMRRPSGSVKQSWMNVFGIARGHLPGSVTRSSSSRCRKGTDGGRWR